MSEILIEISGGTVQNVGGIPKGVSVKIRDYDNKTETEDFSEEVWEEFIPQSKLKP